MNGFGYSSQFAAEGLTGGQHGPDLLMPYRAPVHRLDRSSILTSDNRIGNW